MLISLRILQVRDDFWGVILGSQRAQRGAAATDPVSSIFVTERTESEPEVTEAEFRSESLEILRVLRLDIGVLWVERIGAFGCGPVPRCEMSGLIVEDRLVRLKKGVRELGPGVERESLVV